MIAAEIALAQDIRARGEGVALAAAAAPDAVLFAPLLVWAGPWLKGRAELPGAPLQREPYAVWSSCDGSLVASHGAWRRGPLNGWFTTIWRREGNGRYKWVLDHSAAAPGALAVPEMLTAGVADCPDRARRDGPSPSDRAKPVKIRDLPPLDPARRAAGAVDGSLKWEASVAADGARRLTVMWQKDGAEVELLSEQVPPQAH